MLWALGLPTPTELNDSSCLGKSLLNGYLRYMRHLFTNSLLRPFKAFPLSSLGSSTLSAVGMKFVFAMLGWPKELLSSWVGLKALRASLHSTPLSV